ncbi:hypothetical protein [Asanoa siamensis]|uniref:Uncharacterized protein n=1 Tax=Asanoa siamensis TaxID=926357 RepID=A0ABQ4CK50_9ACTN|nr:hypothetical protein [Asanoa siamensis]GIF71212.1 hypothetical protein Asi02nite_07300 [Asanoa siamensis]
MTDVEIGRFVRSATAAHRAGRDLRDALGGAGSDAAAERLAASIEMGLADLGRAETAWFGPEGAEQRVRTDPDAVLAVVAGQLQLGEVALAAGGAVGETPAPTTTDAGAALDRALADLRATTSTLEDPGPTRGSARVTSRDVPEAVASLRGALGTTLDAIATGTADVVAGPLKTVAGKAPQQLKEAWEKVSKQLYLDNIGGRLVRLGLRALAAALGALRRVVDLDWLTRARDHLVTLADRTVDTGVGAALLGDVIGAERTRTETEARLAGAGLVLGRLDSGSEALAALAARFDSVIGKLALAQAAVGGILLVQGHFGFAVPWLPLALLGAELLIGAVAVALAIDYVDTTVHVGAVRGVRLIVDDAVRVA